MASEVDILLCGPMYPKIQTIWKRDSHNTVIVGEYTQPEFVYLADKPWNWTEKVDGINIRLHWDGQRVTVGGRSDNANLPAQLVDSLADIMDPELWVRAFPDGADDVTVYGEGYGAKIRSGGQYRPDQSVIVFDVLVDRWLSAINAADVAAKLGLDMMPFYGEYSLQEAWDYTASGQLQSHWPDARIEGLVGRPAVDLFNRRGDRIMVKMKVKDQTNYQKKKTDVR